VTAMRYAFHPFIAAGLLALGCEPQPAAPVNPTWADVEPILRGECNHCHGGSAPTTGSVAGAVYRFDFYDLSPEVCGEAMAAMDVPSLARGAASLIRTDVTPPPGVPRPRMPPAPATVLEDWQRETLQRWADRPVKGPAPADNRAPRLEVRRFPASANQQLSFVAVLSDPDGQSAIGVIKVRDAVYKMDRLGSFAVAIDTAAWPAGSHPVTAVLCDGWISTQVEVGVVSVSH
jgi:hypothetical protein